LHKTSCHETWSADARRYRGRVGLIVGKHSVKAQRIQLSHPWAGRKLAKPSRRMTTRYGQGQKRGPEVRLCDDVVRPAGDGLIVMTQSLADRQKGYFDERRIAVAPPEAVQRLGHEVSLPRIGLATSVVEPIEERPDATPSVKIAIAHRSSLSK